MAHSTGQRTALLDIVQRAGLPKEALSWPGLVRWPGTEAEDGLFAMFFSGPIWTGRKVPKPITARATNCRALMWCCLAYRADLIGPLDMVLMRD
jgi:hypothetical protein